MKNALTTMFIFLLVAGCCPCSETIEEAPKKEREHKIDVVDKVEDEIEEVHKTAGEFVLFERYFDYMEKFRGDEFTELVGNYFTQKLIDEGKLDDPSATARLLFKYDVMTVDSHFENINAQNGCLTVNGFGKRKVPLILSLQYTYINKRWLIEDVHLKRIRVAKEFSDSVKCPKDLIK